MRYLSMILSLVMIFACTRFQDEFSKLNYQCQINPDQSSKSLAFVQFVKADGASLTAAERSMAQIRLLTANSSVALELTAGGCVELPPNDGVLQIFIPGTGAHLSRLVSSDEVKQGFFQQWSLESTSNISAALPCPADGWFADDLIPFPLTLQSSSSLASSAIRLYLTQDRNRTSIEIFNKPYGQEVLPPSLSLKSISEGSFTLKFEILQSVMAWDKPLTFPDQNTCSLNVIHKSPSLVGLGLTSSSKRVVKVASDLAWTAADARDRLFVCKEQRAHDEDTLPSDDTCEARSRCLDPQAYTAATKILADEAGVFDYFTYAVNPTGKRSDPQCQRIVVVKDQGTLELSWDDASLNIPAASLRMPVLDRLGASIRISHQERRDSELHDKLQCRMELLQDGVLPLSASAITCRGGRCDGKSLGEYVPCDTHIEASFPSDWLNQGIRPTLVKLHVRTTDGTDRWTEAVKGFWVHPDRWRPVLASHFMQRDSSYDIGDFFVTRSGQLFGNSIHDFALWSDDHGNWQFSDAMDFLGGANRVFLSKSGEAFVFASSPIHQPFMSFAVYRHNGIRWEAMDDHPQLQGCEHSAFLPHPSGGFFCQAGSQILIHNLSEWSEQPLPEDDACQAITVRNQESNFLASKDHSYWYACSDHIYRKDKDGPWQRFEQNFKAIKSMLADRDGRVWVLDASDGEEQDKLMAYYWNDKRWHKVDLPAVTSDLPASLSRGPNGSVLYYDQLWDADSQSWQRLPGLDRLLKKDNFTAFAVDDERVIFGSNDGIGIWTAKAIQYSPLSWYRLSIKDLNPEQIALMPGNELWFIGESVELRGSFSGPRIQNYRLKFRNFTVQGQVLQLYLPTPNSRSSNLWLGQDKEAVLQVDNRGFAYPTLQGFETQWFTQDIQLHASAKIGETLYSIIQDGSLIALHEGTIEEILPTPSENPAGYTLMAQAATQTLWVMGADFSSIWRIRKDQKVKVPLPEILQPRTSPDLMEIRGQLILVGAVKTVEKRGYFRYLESKGVFEAVSAESLKLPSDCSIINVISSTFATCLVYEQPNAARYLINLMDGSRTSLGLPKDVNIYSPSLLMIETQKGDFVVLGEAAIYRGSGQTWTSVMDFRWLSTDYPGVVSQDAARLVEDAHQRLWLAGKPYRVLMIDAP